MPNDNEQYLFSLQGDNYKILEQIGEGGMGIVYRGIDNLMRSVAIKEFSPSQQKKLGESLLTELKEAFYREARLLANLEHPSLPKIHGYFTEAERLYLVMEFIEGDNLKKQAEELSQKFDGQFSIKKVRQWAKELLDVLIYLHDRDSPIFHRDIKPENLKIRNGKICLLDFGLARGSAGNMSAVATKTIFGFTLRYAPIEQMRGEKTTAQTDLYALAATLYYLLTGEEPAESLHRDREIKDNKPDPLRPVKELRPEVDDRFAEVIMQALSIEAHDRPPSARAMWDKLEAHSDPKPIVPPAPTIVGPAPPPLPSPPSPAPVIPPPYYSPAPVPSPVKPSPSSRKPIIAFLVAGAILCLLAVVIFLAISMINRSANTNEQSDTNAQSPSDRTVKLRADRQLYERPSLGEKPIDTLPKDTQVQLEDKRTQKNGNDIFDWYKVTVLNSTKAGWVKCAENEKP